MRNSTSPIRMAKSSAAGVRKQDRRTQHISIRVTEELYNGAAGAAQREGRSIANWVETLIRGALVGQVTPSRRGTATKMIKTAGPTLEMAGE